MAIAGAARADRITDVREVARGGYLAPRFAPAGDEILVSGPKLQGLFLARIDGGVRQLTGDAGAGVHARWTASGAIEYRALQNGVRRDLVVDRRGSVRAAAPEAKVAYARDDRMYALDQRGQLLRIGSGDKFFGAVVAPDKDRVAFQGLVTGIYVYTRSTGALVHVGTGTAPAWSPDSSRLVYERTEDDGHEVVASDLYIFDLATAKSAPVTTSDRVLERRPSFSPDGKSIAYDDDQGRIFVGRLEVSP
jgi:hypothetical protein